MPRTLNELLGIRRKSRAEDQKHQPEERIATFDRRLAMFPTHERQTVSTAVRQAAQIETLSQEQFQELGNTIIDSWERGRLRDLINNVSNTEDPDQLVEIIAEAEILTALNMAEALRTKLKVIAKLQQRIENIDPENNGLENQVREYISQHPWIVSPTWDTFAVEPGVSALKQTAADESGIGRHDDFKDRLGLALSRNGHLLVIEFMPPGLTLSWDHVEGFDQYVRTIRANIEQDDAAQFDRITGYIIAGKLNPSPGLKGRIQSLALDDMFALDWPTLLAQAAAEWQELLDILADRNPQDERLRALLAE